VPKSVTTGNQEYGLAPEDLHAASGSRSARGKASFYRRLGFVDRPADAPGMDFKGSPAQTGAAA
jgi:hypothetical protein